MVLLASIMACTPERRVATNLLRSSNEIPILVIEPDYLFKNNHKAQFTVKGFDSLPDREKDSVQIAESKFVKLLSKENAIGSFNKKMLRELAKYPLIDIYTSDKMAEFLAKGQKGYIFNFSQVQIEEYLSLFRDSTYYNGSKYVQEFDKEAVTMNFWVEITASNRPKEKMKVAFTSVHTYDKISGYFSYDIFSGDVRYNYKMDELNINKIWGMLDYAAVKNARLIFNYILNDQIEEQLYSKSGEEVYFHYDLKHKRPIRAYNKKFKYQFLD